ncbi:hypothetical protein Sgly_2045 [Syntrophobotulus glycolicus DSM 8271]|uniref:TM2 domain-containing protein n=1 Tax=Syntrophobotulus glycolicus (strain DSM 8271 / FlGlyR) TaxID=645991 RepID=F0T1J7_SYNGF|nr:hypothetical protein [Syntrophobotulus glycolicus]ADY56338.1 hypothetical protein Sgly_2045 [Syntrophobotulus glycolicus DSM 8271]
MKKKSKLITFMLSFIPGLGHIYLELIPRGLVFLTATGFVFAMSMLFSIVNFFNAPLPLIAVPVIWLAALVDSFVLVDKINRRALEPTGLDAGDSPVDLTGEFIFENRKILALVFSVIPGAGHMYLGLMEKGLNLMAGFFLTLYLNDFLHLSFLLMFAPLLWFYSVFDVLHKFSDPVIEEKQKVFFTELWKDHQMADNWAKVAGIVLIALGGIMIFDKIVMPQIGLWLSEQIKEYLRTGIIALLFIGGGIKLLMGSKVKAAPNITGMAKIPANEAAEPNIEEQKEKF